MIDEQQTQEEPESQPHGRVTARLVVTRKDGTVEDLGVIGEGRLDFEASSGPS